MKKTIAAFGILLLFTSNIWVVHAGGLNNQESAVVSVAQGQFEKDGVRYQADSAYVSELINYLSLDGVDLTAAQKDEAIAAIYANVEQGIAEGYIVPIETQANQENSDQEDSNQENTTKDSTSEEVTELTDTEQISEEVTATEEHTTVDATEGITEDKAKTVITEIMKQPATTTEIDKENGKVTVTDKNSNNILTVNTVIKNTGFTLNSTVIVAIGMVIIMVICILVTVKTNISLIMMSKKRKRIAAYIGIPLLFTILGYAVLYIAGAPVGTLVDSHAKMIITKGAPSYPNEYDPGLSKLVMNKKGTFDLSEIQVPALETHYGNISCDRIGLEAPIYYGDSDKVYQNGVGQYTASGLPGEGKPILIGGHDSTYFASLEQIAADDVINIVTNYGEFEYKVTATKVADAMDATAYDLSQTQEQLILYTCYPFGQLIGTRSDRYFVYCDRVLDSKTVVE